MIFHSADDKSANKIKYVKLRRCDVITKLLMFFFYRVTQRSKISMFLSLMKASHHILIAFLDNEAFFMSDVNVDIQLRYLGKSSKKATW